jgi:dihydroflavonol-4-reductase
LVAHLLNGRGFTFGGGINVVAGSDVARVHRLAAERGESGRRYIAGGENIGVRDLGRLITRLARVRPLHVPFPRWMQRVLVSFMELAAHVTGRPPLGTRSLVSEMVDRYAYYDYPETRALGYAPRPAEDVVAETIAWLLHLGAIRPRVAGALRGEFPARPEWHALLPAC